MKKLGSVLILAMMLSSITLPITFACTTLTPGYWKNHLEAWPTSGSIMVGTSAYDLADSSDRETLMDLLWEDPGHWKKLYGKLEQAWIILAQKVIAAQLSILKYPHAGWVSGGNFGGYPGGMVGMVEDGNDWLEDYGGGDRALGLDLAETIDYWLNYWDEHGL